ncbi:MAG: hypothetical protein GXP45_01055 [bacterium]|nr:hypothetical protein [bacterium]
MDQLKNNKVNIQAIEKNASNSKDNIQTQEAHTSADNYQTSTSTTNTVVSQDVRAGFKFYLNMTGKVIIGVILLILMIKLIKYFIGFAYDVMNSKRIRYLKVLVPRGDGKLDREQAKEIAKDMKEKIGRMSQVYNNMHKL